MVDMGGDTAQRGLEAQVETYGEAKNFDKAVELARKASEANPKDLDLKLLLAGTLVEQDKNEEALTLTKSLLDSSNFTEAGKPLGKDDKDRMVWIKLGQFYAEMRRWKEADDA